MEGVPPELNIHVQYCTPCGGKRAFDRMAAAIQENVPTAKVTGEEDYRSGAFEVTINGKNVHSRLQTFMYPDVNDTVQAVKSISLGGPIPNSLQRSIFDCILS
ncbi:hypothetical protein ONE63_007647 [Megalurothrips usitatus]|uniref:Migration and invasion enhancer 1 n=1 Tax=Megalurothrips usitatus TaxID=439358 RepID=A0AAV7XND3_9NEOP|nr:hypothetical protein ONE63_007647 [Megalurothrips usitatus]